MVIDKNNLIFMVEDDLGYGKLVRARLVQENFSNIILFTDEKDCLMNMTKKPEAVIIDYHLKSMTGLQFIQKAKAIYLDFFVILFSGEFYKDFRKVSDKRFIRYVDKFIIKGMDDMNEIVDALTNSRSMKWGMNYDKQ